MRIGARMKKLVGATRIRQLIVGVSLLVNPLICSDSWAETRSYADRITFVKGQCPSGQLWSVKSFPKGVCCRQGELPTGETKKKCAPLARVRGEGGHHLVKNSFFCAHREPFEVLCPLGMSPSCQPDPSAPLCDYGLLDELRALSSVSSSRRVPVPKTTTGDGGGVLSALAKISPTPWCGPSDDVSPPDPNQVKGCLDALMSTPLGQCLQALLQQNPKGQDWPKQEDLEKCGCQFSHIDEQTNAQGRKLYTCDGPPQLRISPFGSSLGIMNLDYPGCMFDMSGSPAAPVIPGENCFSCHNRKDPETTGPPCTPTPPNPPSPPTPKTSSCPNIYVSGCKTVRGRARPLTRAELASSCASALRRLNAPAGCVARCVATSLSMRPRQCRTSRVTQPRQPRTSSRRRG
jgi:hypothetical protein